MPVHRPFYLWLRRHPLVSFLLMTVCFIAFGYLTIDLVRLIGSNAEFIFAYGWEALMSGGLLQLAELSLSALLAMACYIFFKLSEQALLKRLSENELSSIKEKRVQYRIDNRDAQ
jgi:hypothetical protein